jgi:hypothetical protein
MYPMVMIKFDDDNMMAVPSSIKNETYTVQQEVK